MINLIDESYNSNPLSLKTAILNYDKIKTKNSKKYLILGDMLELGHHSKKLHESIAPVINRTNIDKVFVKGKEISFLYNKISKPKKGSVLKMPPFTHDIHLASRQIEYVGYKSFGLELNLR